MSTETPINFAIYLTEATSAHGVGYVVNNVICDSASTPTVATGQAAIADANRTYPIGSTYTASSS